MALLENDETGFLSVFTMKNIAKAANEFICFHNRIDFYWVHDTNFWHQYLMRDDDYGIQMRALGKYPEIDISHKFA